MKKLSWCKHLDKEYTGEQNRKGEYFWYCCDCNHSGWDKVKDKRSKKDGEE